MPELTVNIDVVAKEMGLSTATISRALRNKPEVSQRTRQKIIDHLEKKGYLSRNREIRHIGIVGGFADFSQHTEDHYLSRILYTINHELVRRAIYPVLISREEFRGPEAFINISGVLSTLSGVIWAHDEYDSATHKLIEAQDLPCVAINHCSPEINQHLVSSDHFNAAKTITEYLIGRGHRRIGFVGGLFGLQDHKERFRGYSSAMQDGGIEIDENWIISDLTCFNGDNGKEAIHRIMTKPVRPTAIMLVNDRLALGVYRGIRELGYTIPEDLSIVGFDDFPFAPFLDPPLSSVRQEVELMARTAINELMNIIESPEEVYRKVVRKYFPTRFFSRGSVRSLPG